jgi:O-antigen/teichoic acid export membrane protein
MHKESAGNRQHLTDAGKAAAGSLFNTAASWIVVLVGLLKFFVLSRLLVPEDFGVVALALFFVSGMSQISGAGLQRAFVYKRENIEEATTVYFLLRAVFAAVFAAIALLFAPVLRTIYIEQPRMIDALVVLIFVYFVKALNSAPDTRLRKQLDFRYIGLVEIAVSVSMASVAIPMAFAGMGFWSLVGEQIAAEAVKSVFFWIVRRPCKFMRTRTNLCAVGNGLPPVPWLTRISHKIPAANSDSTTATARIGKTRDCSMSTRLLRRFTNLNPRSSTFRSLTTKFCEICGLRARIRWNTVTWYLKFGGIGTIGLVLVFIFNQFDDFWIGTTLSAGLLGMYSRSYTLARYPKRLLARPLSGVFLYAYAKFQNDREWLSRAYAVALTLISRAGFLISLVLMVTAPEAVRLFMGPRWLPMVAPFRLLLVYMLADSLLDSSDHLITVSGRPDLVTRIRGIQTGIFVPAVAILSAWFGICGVALAVDLAVLAALALSFRYVGRFVDFNAARVLIWPLAAAFVGAAAAIAADMAVAPADSTGGFALKGCVAAAVYAVALMFVEKRLYKEIISDVILYWKAARGVSVKN